MSNTPKTSKKRGGVKSQQGKSITRFNARTHGVLSTLLTKYEKNVYKYYLDQLFEEFQPQTFIEQVLVERIAVCYLRLFRSGRAEQEFMKTRFDPSMLELASVDLEGGYRATLDHEAVSHLSRTYMRYETSIENRLYKALHELERIQRMRRGEKVEAPIAMDVQHHAEFVSQNQQ